MEHNQGNARKKQLPVLLLKNSGGDHKEHLELHDQNKKPDGTLDKQSGVEIFLLVIQREEVGRDIQLEQVFPHQPFPGCYDKWLLTLGWVLVSCRTQGFQKDVGGDMPVQLHEGWHASGRYFEP